MLEWFLEVSLLLSKIRLKVQDALEALCANETGTTSVLQQYLRTEYQELCNIWKQRLTMSELGYLGRHIGFGKAHDYQDILRHDIPKIEEKAENHLRESLNQQGPIGFEELLHPIILEKAYQQYCSGHLRDAVLNSITAVFDFIRQRTGLTLDGNRLIGEVLSSDHPRLILSELKTESGHNDQIGFMQIFQGVYKGIRNPKAHTLKHDLNEHKAAQYLIFASLLARRIEEAKEAKESDP
jgi:uncharacterized protein (TIGR02391 family)